MKNIIKATCLLVLAGIILGGCSKFDQINTDPTAASADQVQVEYFIDNSIIHAQMNPGVSERTFVLYWVPGGRQIADADGATFSVGAYEDEWISEYYNNISQALTYINTGITVANQQIAAGTEKPYTNNLLQVARIWRAYLMSEMSDNFGPIPDSGFQGKNPDFNSVKDVYYYLLAELKDASSKLNLSVTSSQIANEDPAYGFDYSKWQRYANSLRLRLAMRLSEVDPQKAQAEFEDADKLPLLTDNSQIFQIQEKPGWDDLSGMYTRCWYLLPLSTTLDNLVVNLGSITSAQQLPTVISPDSLSSAIANIKPADYVGQKYTDYFSMQTNNPVTGYWFDGMPQTIDPRMYQMFYIPGDVDNADFPSGTCGAVISNTVADLMDPTNTNKVVKAVNAKFTWNGIQDGYNGTTWGNINGLITIGGANGFVPSLGNQFRQQKAQRVFFAPWETYFLLAEAAVRGWSTPVAGKQAYESGVASSFQYWGVSQYLNAYLASTDYNNDGTCVNWDDTQEPPATHTMTYVGGMTGDSGTVQIAYPVNNLYKGGTLKNDLLTKIITQKFIAQTPWLPLETWSDHRRLGLPFFENVVFQGSISTLPNLTSSNYMQCSVQNLPQRMKYPSGLRNSNANGYNQAVSLLGSGGDAVLTPLWWAQH